MELKSYQRRILDRIRDYARLVAETGSGPAAYGEYLEAQGLRVGDDGVHGYSMELGDVPKVCVKVPTGGGKTLIAAAALKVLDDNLPPVEERAVVWLVPRREILRQTLGHLRDPGDMLRQTIDHGFSHRVEVLDKEEALVGRGLNVAAVGGQLTIFVLSYDSFKNKDGRRAFQENSALEPLTRHQRATGSAHAVEGADDTALISALAGLHPIVIVDESHHAGSDLSIGMLRNLNPRFVLELTATPTTKANVIARATAAELKREQMVKLPVIVYRRDGKREVVRDAVMLQRRLEQVAERDREATGRYIRPIVLFQAERRGDDDAETYRRLRGKIVDAGIPPEWIAIRTGDVDELKGVDLMSEECPIRFVITVEALGEGWDCPFAYVLATVANKRSRTDVEQIIGRVLRQPYATKAKARALNISYVLTSSADFDSTIDQVVAGLNGAGFSERDVVADREPSRAPQAEPVAPPLFDDDEPEGHEHDDLDGLDLSVHTAAPVPGAAPDTAEAGIDDMIRASERAESDFERRVDDGGMPTPDDSGLGGKEVRYAIRDAVAASVEDLRLPRFRIRREESAGLFAGLDDADKELAPRDLLEDFLAGECSVRDMRLDGLGLADARQIDVDDEFRVRATRVAAEYEAMARGLFSRDAPERKRKTLTRGLLDCIPAQTRGLYGDAELRKVIRHVLEGRDDAALDDIYDHMGVCAQAIVDGIDLQADDYKRRTFDRLVTTEEIRVECDYRLPDSIRANTPLDSLPRSLYTAEENDMNQLERRMADMLANCGNILWWHRVRDQQRGEFSINGFINHYPDFLAMTRGGKVLAIETKGEQLKNRDSRDKLAMGTRWASMAGAGFRYFMVFDNDPLEGAGAYAMTAFGHDILDHIA